jgi:hypothetical protein
MSRSVIIPTGTGRSIGDLVATTAPTCFSNTSLGTSESGNVASTATRSRLQMAPTFMIDDLSLRPLGPAAARRMELRLRHSLQCV